MKIKFGHEDVRKKLYLDDWPSTFPLPVIGDYNLRQAEGAG